MAEESAVKVCVRVRPLIEREEKASAEDAEPIQMFWKADHKSIQQIDDGNSGKSFIFDRVFTADENTNQLYQSFAKPLVVSAVEGYNGTIFAYGQTSSGKTFTMMGSSGTPGVIPLAVEDVFQTIKNFPKKEFLLRVSYMEIYNETVTDLLVDSWKRKPLEVREASNKNIYVADLTEEVVTSPAQALNWIRKGEKNRHYGQTKMNHRSSRSHTIFRMILESRDRSDPASGENADGAIIVSHLNLVDLAGSERASQTGAEGARFKEGCNINRSLFTLGQVIKKLTDESQKGFTNYRDSKLTRILQNSLGGNAKTVIICTITAAALEDTLSTLQFASTAKKMKNDPHVTEVSDDGALLKRYRNEIVDLKRRLQEVSSVTQTTATEKEVLSQLLQEKDQLQREQEDRIRNLTRLLVTSSNQATAPQMPKRRVTWGGKMLRLAHSSAFEGGISELSFAEPFSRKRKGDRSCLSEMAGDDEDFQWEVPEELSEDMEINQSSVMIRSFGDSPKDFISPDRMHELTGKVSKLESQLEVEVQQREEATMKVETAEGRVSELEQQLETEVQQKLEALEKVEMMEVRASDLERQLEEKSHSPSDCDDQMRREFAETIQLCEHLASEKEMLAAERDYLKQELGMFIEQMESLEKEKAELSKELEEKRETDEFKSLEEEFRKEHENELQNEISTWKAAVEASELQRQELQNKMDALSQELKKKSDFAEELQNMSGKDLVQEVEKLRRSLDDAEGVSRDTKKEWAHLRSQNITLEEANDTLTKNHDKMEAEVNSLRFQLESEKTRFRQMQGDLQRELNVVFDENTKLTTLLDGKVPKNLIDSIELERTVADLNKELTAAREAESTLGAQMEGLKQQMCELTEELHTTQTHRDALTSAQTQSEEEAQQLRGALQVSQEEVLNIRAELSSAALTEEQLKVDVESLRQTLEESEEEKLQLTSAVQEKQSKLTESEEQREALMEKLNEMQQLGKDLEEKLADSEVSRATEEEISKELQEQLNQLTEELQAVRAEKDVLLNDRGQSSEETEKVISAVTAERDQLRSELQRQEEMAADTRDVIQSLQNELQQQRSNLEEQVKNLSEELHCVRAEKETFQLEAQTSAEEAEKLLSTVSSLTAERDQLQTDMQENVEMMIENQAELRTALEKNAVQKELIKQLQAEKTPRQDDPSPSDMETQELQTQMCAVRDELQSVISERDTLLRERNSHSQSEEMEELQRRLTSVSEDRDQLQESVDALRQQKQQLREDMEDKIDSLQAEVSQLNVTLMEQKRELEERLQESTSTIQTLMEELQRVSAEKDDQMKSLSEQLAEARAKREAMLMEKEERDRSSSVEVEELQDTLSTLRRERQQLTEETEDKINTLQAEMCAVRDELQSVISERDALLCERTADSHCQSEEVEELQRRLTSVSEDKDQLQESVDALRQQKQQLREDMEDKIHSLQAEVFSTQEHLKSVQEKLQENQQVNSELEREGQEKERTSVQQIQTLTEELQRVSAEKDDQMRSLSEQLAEARAEREAMLMEKEERDRSSSVEVEELQDTLSTLRRERQQLTEETEDKINTLQAEMCAVRDELQSVISERDALLHERMADSHCQSEEVEELQRRLTSVGEDKDQLQESVDALRQQKQQLREDMEDKIHSLQAEMCAVRDELQSVISERDALLRERTADSHCQSEEMEELQRRLTSVGEDKDQLQESVDALRQQKQQLREDMEDKINSLQAEVSQLNVTLQTLMKQKRELEDSLQESINTTSTTQDLLKSVQEELQEQQQINSDLVQDRQEKESTVDQQIQTLTEELQRVSAEKDDQMKSLSEQLAEARAEREAMLMEKEERDRSSSVEVEELQDTLSTLRRERQQLTEETEDKINTLQAEIEAVRDQLQSVASERDALLRERTADSHTQSEKMEKIQERLISLTAERDQLHESVILLEAKMALLTDEMKEKVDTLQEEVQQLEEKLRVSRGKQAESRKEADSLLQLLTEANETISALKDQLSSLDQSSRFKETAALRLQESADHFQDLFRRLQDLFNVSSRYNRAPMGLRQTAKDSKQHQPTHWPKRTKDAHKAFSVLGQQCVHILDKYVSDVPVRLRDYMKLFEELVKSELDIFEEKRLQDVLLCRAQAGTFSVKDQDFNSLWEQRLTELLDTRKLLVQKSTVVWEKLEANTVWFAEGMRAECTLRERFDEQMDALSAKKPNNFCELDAFLSQEQDNRSALLDSRKAMLPVIEEEHRSLFEELRTLQTQTSARLKDERGKTSTLLQALKGAPLKTEVSLLKDNQQLALQLQQTSEEVKALCAQRNQLEEAQAKANNMLSNHKEATQLLQTELQDSRAKVEDKENVIQSLRSKLRESEKNASPSAVEMEKLRSKLFKVEVELRSASDKHQQEIQRMTALLKEKEVSLRKLKETLRIAQQQGDESILQGQDLHNRLTDPRGFTLKSVQLEKTKLEEEVQKLKMKIIEMESLVSSQQAEITKWKSRAVKLKTKTQADMEKPSPPRTPTKRGFPAIAGSSNLYSSPKKFLGTPRKVLDSPRKVLDSPRKVLDSPKVNTLDSPKSRFFDVGGSSDLLSRTCPKQFFDNSSLGTVPGAEASADKKAEWWSESPEMEECCKTQ